MSSNGPRTEVLMLTVPFLTDLDSRALVKGSRDPLGIQQIWVGFGRKVIGNLTMASSSVRDFTTLLVGYYFAEQLSHDLGSGSELATFLKWEQLGAYSRVKANGESGFRGTERVHKNLSEGSRVTLSDESAHQILSNQKIYGLWGLYSMPSRASGLLDGNPGRLTTESREIVEKIYIPILSKSGGQDARRVVQVLKPKSYRLDVDGADSALIQAVGLLLKHELHGSEEDFYRSHLLYGGPDDKTDGRQRQLAELLETTLTQKDFYWSPATVAELAKMARLRGEAWHSLASRLQRIAICESVLAPVSALFTHLLGLDGKTVSFIVDRLNKEWGPTIPSINSHEFRELRDEIASDDLTTGDRWVEIADAVGSGNYSRLIDLLSEQNKAVMADRGGSPWIERSEGKLKVRFRDEQGNLPSRDQLASLWRFPYFLGSLRSVASAVNGI